MTMNLFLAIGIAVAVGAICLLIGYACRENVAGAKVAKAEDAGMEL